MRGSWALTCPIDINSADTSEAQAKYEEIKKIEFIFFYPLNKFGREERVGQYNSVIVCLLRGFACVDMYIVFGSFSLCLFLSHSLDYNDNVVVSIDVNCEWMIFISYIFCIRSKE